MKKLYTLLSVAIAIIDAFAQPCEADVQVSPVYDTICDGNNTSVILSSKMLNDTLRYRYTVEIPSGVTIIPGSDTGLLPGYEITDQIVNTTDATKLVLFIVTPYLINPDETENCVGSPDTAYVWVEPTVRASLTVKDDTIYDGDNVSITLTSPSVPSREVRFRYTVETPPGVTATPGIDSNLPPHFTITDQIDNTTDASQLVKFILSPYTRNAADDGEKCTGINDTVLIWVKPESDIMVVTVDMVIEDPCEGGNGGAIEITVTGGNPPYQFGWEGPFGITHDTEDIFDIPGGDWNLTVTDSLGATVAEAVFVPIASGMLTSLQRSEYGPIEQSYNISEYGKSDGWIWIEYVLNGNGDLENYSFICDHNGWKYSLSFGDTISGLNAGDYTLVVTDSIGCTDTISLALTQPDPETVIDTVEVIKFTEVAEEATLINPVTQATIWVKNFGDWIRTSETFDLCKVYNMTGSIVKQVKNETDIRVSDLNTGIYIFYLEFGSAEIVQRFYIK